MDIPLHLSNSTAHNLTSIFSEIDPRVLQPHPRNSSIYGENEDVTELVKLIRHSQWVRPLVITKEGTIISGHRRWKAVLQLGWKTVPVEVREFPDEITELQTLLLENANRSKTTEQKVREGKAWFEIESKAAKQRMSEGGKKLASGRKGMENFPYLCLSSTKGTTRDRLAQRVGIGSGRTYAKATKVVEFIDQQASLGNLEKAEELRQLLNTKSVDAAYQLLKLASKSSHSNQTITDSQSSQETVRSCWNCQHRLESTDNQSIYCNKFGILNLIYKSGEARGKECSEWREQNLAPEQLKNQMFTLQLLLPLEWQAKLEETAASLGTDAATWVTNLISAFLFSKLEGQNSDQSAATQPIKTQENTTNSAFASYGDFDNCKYHKQHIFTNSSTNVDPGIVGCTREFEHQSGIDNGTERVFFQIPQLRPFPCTPNSVIAKQHKYQTVFTLPAQYGNSPQISGNRLSILPKPQYIPL